MKYINRKLLASLTLLSIGAVLFACRFGQETPILFTNNSGLCPSLRGIPFGEDTGIIKNVTSIKIEGIRAPYNPGLVEDGDGFFLVFRWVFFYLNLGKK